MIAGKIVRQVRKKQSGEASNSGRILGIVAVILGLLVAIGPDYVFPVCQYYGLMVETAGGTYLPMPCWYTAMAEVGIGAMIVMVGLLLILTKQNETRRALGFVLGALGVFVALVPTYLIGMCANPEHPCRVGTEPFLILMGVIVFVVGIVTAVISRGGVQN
jgi:uncharacterized membrane protein HdeD (DUF308 family)